MLLTALEASPREASTRIERGLGVTGQVAMDGRNAYYKENNMEMKSAQLRSQGIGEARIANAFCDCKYFIGTSRYCILTH
jgi:hypothetical protein